MSDASTDDARNALAELVEGHSDDEITKAAEELGIDTLLDQVFEGMEQAFQPDKAAGQNAVVQWDVDAPDGKHSRTVHIADGTCKVEPGGAESPRLDADAHPARLPAVRRRAARRHAGVHERKAEARR